MGLHVFFVFFFLLVFCERTDWFSLCLELTWISPLIRAVLCVLKEFSNVEKFSRFFNTYMHLCFMTHVYVYDLLYISILFSVAGSPPPTHTILFLKKEKKRGDHLHFYFLSVVWFYIMSDLHMACKLTHAHTRVHKRARVHSCTHIHYLQPVLLMFILNFHNVNECSRQDSCWWQRFVYSRTSAN